MKADAYSRIMEQLSQLEYYDARFLEALERGGDMSGEALMKAADESADASRALQKAAAIGALIISEKAVKALRQLLKEPRSVEDWGDFYEVASKSLDAARTCMETIREEAARELKGR